jgi:hypothetical protein
MKRGIKLYVWEEVLVDYTDGVMFALATSADEARQIIMEESGGLPSVELDLEQEPKEYTDKVGFFLYGGG